MVQASILRARKLQMYSSVVVVVVNVIIVNINII